MKNAYTRAARIKVPKPAVVAIAKNKPVEVEKKDLFPNPVRDKFQSRSPRLLSRSRH
jgi:hypothetical protein